MSTIQTKIKKLEKINKLLRYWILDMTTTAGSGHPTSSLSGVELMSALMYSGVFKFDIKNIDNPHNDRLIFSKGHASPLFYALWAGGDAVPAEKLNTFRKIDSDLEGHPTPNFPFTEATTGSLGQGLSVGVGLALAQKRLDKTKARTYVLLGDSEMAEGQNYEAMELAGYYNLDNLIAIVDVNRLGQRGETMLGHDTEKYAGRAKAFGWRTVVVDGHNVEELLRVYSDLIGEHKKPLMIIAKTYKGRGISFLEDKYSWHGKVLSKQQLAEAVGELGDIDFDLRCDIAKPHNRVDSFNKKQVLSKVDFALGVDEGDKYATRDAYGRTLAKMMMNDEKIVVLDAEVSNSTRADFVREYFPDRFFEMFIAEQNMVSVAVGLSQRGYRPFVSTFAAFLTRAHDQIRMARLSNADITFTGSHAGVSIGADGGSQMGLCDIAMFRSLLDSVVFYPSDVVSAGKLIELVKDVPNISYVRTTREKTPILYDADEKFEIGGLKIIKKSENDEVVIIAGGITLHEALKAYNILQTQKINIRVIDLYSVKPINKKKLLGAIGKIKQIIVAEDHYSEGGMGESVRTTLSDNCIGINHLAVKKIPHSGTSGELLEYENIDYNAIINEVNKIIKK